VTVPVRSRAGRAGPPDAPRRGRRALLALVVGGLSSGGNLLVAVTVTRLESIGGVGEFALAFSCYVLGSGLVRSMVTEATLAAGTGVATATRRVVLLGVLCGGPVGAAGVAYGSPYLVGVGLALPGLVLYDHAKAVAVGLGVPSGALWQEATWAAVTCCAALAGLLGLVDAPWSGAATPCGPAGTSTGRSAGSRWDSVRSSCSPPGRRRCR
jgi:hypothetical protein